jgi:hypothetical protein
MSTKASTKARSTKARSTKARSTKARSTKARGTKARGTKGEKADQSSGKIKGGTEVGVETGDRTLGKIKAGAEVGVESDHSFNEIKEVADDALDNIKSGFKAARKKISHLYD